METIAAVATAHGIGSIAVVRISGDGAYEILSKITKNDKIIPRYATLSYLYDENDEVIDEAIVIYFKSPHSFTGEDVIELQCHGGIAVANAILETVIKYGARLANPGEFSKRAFLNGKIDLTKAEAIVKIIETKSSDAIKILSRQIKGELKKFIDELRDELVEILAYTEVNIDYAEEDLPPSLVDEIKNRLENIYTKMQKTLKASLQKEGLINGFNVCIVGKPNVGKSSLLNKLLNSNRAIISEMAGTTRDTIEEEIKIGTHLVKIIDTAGIREAKDHIEKIGVERSIKAIENSDIVLAIFDNSKPCDEEDKKIIELVNNYKNSKKIFVFLNKTDLKNEFNFSCIEDLDPIKIIAKDDVEVVMNTLEKYLNTQTVQDSLIFSSKRQIDEIKRVTKAIKNSYEPLYDGELELFAYEINDAISHISSITTRFDNEEMLDKMFGSFCLGK